MGSGGRNATVPLDAVDTKMLHKLKHDGRISITRLAKCIGQSRAATSERLSRLVHDGVILGYSAVINSTESSCGLMILTRICLERSDAAASDAFKAAAMSRSEIVECHEVDGDFDYLLKTRIPDMARYRAVLAALPHIRESRSFTVIDEVKVCEREGPQ